MSEKKQDKKHCPELEDMLSHFPAWIKYVQFIICLFILSILLLSYLYMPFLFRKQERIVLCSQFY